MRCLVTGAAGFIGNALTKRLAEEGHKVKGVIHQKKLQSLVKNVEYVTGDITDKESIKSAFKDVDVVFHCAAVVKDYGPEKMFYKINLEGTKNVVEICEEDGVKRFIFLSHQTYEPKEKLEFYSKTKALAEQYLNEKYKREKFPVVIIRPGNVYGPGNAIWVIRVLNAIKRNRVTLINEGKGIFLHTYIDNLIDALMVAMKEKKAIGKTIDITDGDNSISWAEYLNSLARMAGKNPIEKNLSKNTALLIGKAMIFLHRIFGIKPKVTPMTVYIFTNKKKISIKKAKQVLNYEPGIDYGEGMKRVENWLRNEGHIS